MGDLDEKYKIIDDVTPANVPLAAKYKKWVLWSHCIDTGWLTDWRVYTRAS